MKSMKNLVNWTKKFNLIGFGVGNPTTNISTDFFLGTYRTWFARALISQSTWQGIEKYCNIPDYLNPAPNCQSYLNEAQNQFGNINPYDIQVDSCVPGQQQRLLEMMYSTGRLGQHSKNQIPYRPCLDGYVQSYMNNWLLKKSIHANPDIFWTDCTNNPLFTYNYTNFYNSMLPLYRYFMDSTNLKITVFSGDADTVVPYLGTQHWVNAINGPPVQKWTAWNVNGQVAGFFQVHKRMQFVTVRNAGHMIPLTQPLRGFELFKRFILVQKPTTPQPDAEI